jgi:hypothetical protein
VLGRRFRFLRRPTRRPIRAMKRRVPGRVWRRRCSSFQSHQ